MKRTLAILVVLFVSGIGAAHEAKSLDELLQAWGMDINAVEVTVETVSPGIHVLYGAGGNVAVSIGDQGNSLEEVMAATPTAEFDETYGDPALLINRAYKSLAR